MHEIYLRLKVGHLWLPKTLSDFKINKIRAGSVTLLHGRILVRTLRKGPWVFREDAVRKYCEDSSSLDLYSQTSQDLAAGGLVLCGAIL